MTTDPEKIHIFETDPCGMKGFYREVIDGVVYHRGNCTLPNQVRYSVTKDNLSVIYPITYITSLSSKVYLLVQKLL